MKQKNIFLRTFSIIWIFGLLLFANVLNAQFASGSGTEADPYIILTKDQLKNFAIQTNSGTTYEGKYINLGDDIDCGYIGNYDSYIAGFIPTIGSVDAGSNIRPFKGHFDGKGYTISRSISHAPLASGLPAYPYSGFFGYTEDAEIKNLRLSDCSVWGGNGNSGTGTDAGDYLGGLIGYAKGKTIVDHCSYSGEVYTIGDNVGGLIGYAEDTLIVVNSSSSAIVGGVDNVGGFIGNAAGVCTITNCYTTSAIECLRRYSNSSIGGDNAGGFAGILSDKSTINDSYATGLIEAGVTYDAFAVLSGSPTINDCYYDEDMSGEATANATGLTREEFHDFSNFSGWLSGTDSINPWIEPAYPEGARRPYLYTQEAMVTNDIVNDGPIKNNKINVTIKRSSGSTVTVVRSGVRIRVPGVDNKWFHQSGGETVFANDTINFSLRIKGLDGGDYYVQAYFVDEDSIFYFGDLIRPEIIPEHNVTYQPNDVSRVGTATGTVTDSDNPHIENLDVTVLANGFSLTGYNFSSWNTTPDGSGTNRAPASTFAITDSTPLYAQWTAIDYDITYENTFGATNSNPATYIIEGATTFSAITRTGYDFDKWYSNSGLTTEITGLAEGDYGDITVYAGWIAKDYQILFDENDGSGSIAPLNVTYDQSTTLTANTFTRTGYTFSGWNTSANGSGTSYSNSQTFTYTTDGNTRLYAQWTPNNYQVIFNKNAGDAVGSMGNQTVAFATATALNANTFTRPGYQFGGWTTNADGTGDAYANNGNITISTPANVNLYVKWAPNSATAYNTEYYLENVGNANYTLDETVELFGKTDSVVNAVIRSYTGFTLLTHTSDSIAGDGSTVLEVYYSRTRHSVAFNSQGGTAVSTITGIKYGATTTLPTAPTRTGYTFDGWRLNADGSGDSFTAATVITANMTVYAKWITNIYNIDYNLIAGVTNHASNPATYTYENAVPLGTPSRTGYTFDGWYNNSGFTGSAITSIPVNSTGDKDFWAKWIANDYTLTYQNLGAANRGSNPATYTIEDNVVFTTIPQTGYNFDGWYSDANLTIPYNLSPATAIPAGNYGNKNIYAKWDTIQYSITYSNLQNGTNHDDNPSFYIHNKAVTFGNPERTGYNFDGWFTDAAFTPANITTGIAQYQTGNVEVWAKWSPIEYIITFNANTGDGGSMSNQTVEFEVAENLNAIGFTKTGHTFNGWATTAGGDSAYADQDSYTLSQANNIILYAKWKANTYNVVFNSNHTGTVTGTMADQAMVFGQATQLNDNNFAVSGYTFTGWNTAANGSGTTYSNEENYTISTAGNETLFAQWVAGTATPYTVEHYQEDLEGNYSVYQTQNLSGATDAPISASIRTYTGFIHASTHPDRVESGTIDGAGNTVLKVYYSRTLHSVTFDSQGGTAVSTVSNIRYGDSIAMPVNPTKTGYTFNGWNTTTNGVSGEVFDNTYNVTEDITVYAQWLLNTYDITYETNSGTHAGTPATYTYETPTFSFTNPSRTGYTFQGWHTDSGFTNDITGITLGSRTGDLTIYAQWSLNTYNITYHNDDNDTDLTTNPATYTYEASVTFTDTITRTGFGFIGWYESDLTTPFNVIPLNSTGNKDVYIKWDTIDYKITYRLNFGTNANNNNPDSYRFEESVSYEDPEREGYVFNGWYSDEALTISTNGIALNSTGEVEVWAGWTPDTYDIVFDVNTGEGTMANQQAQFTITETLNANSYTRTGYTFDSWNSLPDGTGSSYNDESDYTVNTPNNDTIYAQWEAIIYTINYETNGGLNSGMNPPSYTIEDSVVFDSARRAGYDFKGWYTDMGMQNNLITKIDSGSIGEITLYARWENEGDYKIDYFMGDDQVDLAENGSGNPFIYNVETETITFENASHPGYTFTGWETNAGTSITQLPKGSVGDTALYATWTIDSTANRFSIAYDTDGGTNSVNNPSSYFFDTDTIFFEDPAKDHYTFNGWYGDSLFTVSAPYIAQGSFSDTTIYAEWIILPENGFAISYDLDGGTNNVSNPDSFNIETPTITFATPVRTGYTFGAWFADSVFTDTITELVQGSAGDTTIYAQWTIGPDNIYTIKYELDGGDNSTSNPSLYNVETPTITFENAIKTGYTFAGWFTDNTFTTQVTDLPAGTVGDTTIYAQWTIGPDNIYTINYELNGGNNSVNNPVTYNVETPTINFEDPTRGGYIFDGWYTEASFSNEITDITTGSVGDTTIHAKWIVSIEIICKWGYVLLVNDPDNLLENSYQWYKDGILIPGANEVSYAGPNKSLCGNYTCEVKPVNSNASDALVVLEPYTASFNCGLQSVKVYPSVMSSNSMFNIEINDTESYSDYFIEIYDMRGVKLFSQITEPNGNTEVISPFAAGCYIVKISNSTGIIKVERITVE